MQNDYHEEAIGGTFKEEIKQILVSQADSADALEKVKTTLRMECGVGGRYDLFKSEPINDGVDAYYYIANFLEANNFFTASEILLYEWWNSLCLMQSQYKKYVYKGATAFKIMEHYLRLNDRGSALRWALLTHGSDALVGHLIGGGASYLKTAFGISAEAFDLLNEIAAMCRNKIDELDGDWSVPEAFPEYVMTEFFKQPITSPLLSEAGSNREYYLSPTFFQALLNRVSSDATNIQKGNSLEDLAFYLMLLMPGCLPRRKVLDEKQAGEADLVVHNLALNSNINTELFGRHFLIECKNWKNKIGVQEVGYFLERMNLAHADFGIIFSQQGITGSGENIASDALIQKAFQRNNAVCIIIDNGDLREIVGLPQYNGVKRFLPVE